MVQGYTDMLGIARYIGIAHLSSPSSAVPASDVLLLYTGKQ